MSTYAKGTKVSVEKSQAEIQTILRRYGATEFFSAWVEEPAPSAAIGFRINGRMVRLELTAPKLEDFRCNAAGKRLGDALAPQLDAMYADGKMPRLLGNWS